MFASVSKDRLSVLERLAVNARLLLNLFTFPQVINKCIKKRMLTFMYNCNWQKTKNKSSESAF